MNNDERFAVTDWKFDFSQLHTGIIGINCGGYTIGFTKFPRAILCAACIPFMKHPCAVIWVFLRY